MKKITLIFAGIFSVLGLNAQTTDTVSTGAGYANSVYYNLDNNEVHSAEAGNWDIAFTVSGMGSTIRTNGGFGVELYNYPNGDTSHGSSVDTSGMSSWKKYYNSDSLWSKGAFSQTADGMDMGWGNYSMITHYVTADSLFVIKLPDGEYKKFWIDRLASGVYYFKYADLDGTNEVLDTVAKADYVNKSFGYYSIQNGTEVDREPDKDSWDMVFTKYGQSITPSYYMGVSGVLTNEGVSVNKVEGVHSLDADTLTTPFSSSMTSIGYDWKKLDYSTYQYSAVDSLTYFVKSKVGDLWKVVFTGFGGSSSGNYIFTKEKIFSVDVNENNEDLKVATYPNPTSDFLNIVLHQNSTENLEVTVLNLSGAIVYSKNFTGFSGVNNIQLNVSEFSQGLYIINVKNQGVSVQRKFVVK